MTSTKHSISAGTVGSSFARSSVARFLLATAFAVLLSMLACGAYAANGVNTSNSTTDLPIGAGGNQYMDISPAGQIYFGTGNVGSSNYKAYIDPTTGNAYFAGLSASNNISVMTSGDSNDDVIITGNQVYNSGGSGKLYLNYAAPASTVYVGGGTTQQNLTISNGNLTVSSGDIKDSSGNLTLSNGNLTLNSGDISVSGTSALGGNVTVSNANLTVTGSGNLITTPSLNATTAILTPTLYLGSTANAGDELTSTSATDLLAIQNSKCGAGYALTTSSTGVIGCTQVTTIDGSAGNLTIPSCTSTQFVTANGSSFGCAAAVEPPTCSGGMTANGTTIVTSGSSGLGCASGGLQLNNGYFTMAQTFWSNTDEIFMDNDSLNNVGGALWLNEFGGDNGFVIIGNNGTTQTPTVNGTVVQPVTTENLQMPKGNFYLQNGNEYLTGGTLTVSNNAADSTDSLYFTGNQVTNTGGALYLNYGSTSGSSVIVGGGSTTQNLSIPNGNITVTDGNGYDGVVNAWRFVSGNQIWTGGGHIISGIPGNSSAAPLVLDTPPSQGLVVRTDNAVGGGTLQTGTYTDMMYVNPTGNASAPGELQVLGDAIIGTTLTTGGNVKIGNGSTNYNLCLNGTCAQNMPHQYNVTITPTLANYNGLCTAHSYDPPSTAGVAAGYGYFAACVSACNRYCSSGCVSAGNPLNCAGPDGGLGFSGGTAVEGSSTTVTCQCF